MAIKINQKRIRNIDKFQRLLRNQKINACTISYHVINQDDLKKIGFKTLPQNSDCILPKIIGSVSEFNSLGRWNIHKDQPKEPRFIRTMEWELTDWGGNVHYGTNDIYKDCYPRTFIEPPSMEITFCNNVLFSNKINTNDTFALKHAINLFLEYFGQCEICDVNGMPIEKINRVNWQLLPPGKQPFNSIAKYIDEISTTSRKSSDSIKKRQKQIFNFTPNETWIGTAGFEGYIAYVFDECVIFESVKYGNATYIFGKDWQEISKLTKKEILDQNLATARIIHTTEWESQLSNYLK